MHTFSLSRLLVGFHRPYSDLLFNPLEILSTCKMGAPDSVSVGKLINIHTVRCLKAIEGQIQLMALPARPFHHSPFVICMVIAGTIPFLSACKFLFTKERLEIARHQIRLSIGCLKSLADVWPQGAINIREVQMIAQEVLARPPNKEQDISLNGMNGAETVDSGFSIQVDPYETPTEEIVSFSSLDDALQPCWDISSVPADTCLYGATGIR